MTTLRDAVGPYFGEFGGRFVPESLVAALDELDEAYRAAAVDPEFQAELAALHKTYTGRPSIITEVPRFAEHAGGARIILKREDLNHTGSHKINNVLGQALLARKLGKTRLIAETGAGQHGVATATAAALFGMECVVYMGEVDTERQALNVARMRLLGAEVIPVATGSRTLKDAINDALRDWVSSVETTHYVLGTVAGPHPFPTMVRDFHKIIGEEARQQVLDLTGALPDIVTACIGGGSNAIGIFDAFLDDASVELYGFEAGAMASSPVDTPRPSPSAAPASCRAPSPTSCKTKTARPSRATRSPRGSTILPSGRSTPGSPRSAGSTTSPSPTKTPWRRSGCSAARRASSRPSSRRTPWPARSASAATGAQERPSSSLCRAGATKTWPAPAATSESSTRRGSSCDRLQYQ
ncbi:hypothetical protein GCM10025867_28850 [Frondihabitans sucicola]|uniref:tryptophan synthase n=1 Tax=Frondihabitans sucicola TaxID=1268041 RepID=A0ABN6Y030_9MICO|nr:hypothetical protein GCM10025867_28850 [Frondihabitans sucicola]